jgi:hypothetical protein
MAPLLPLKAKEIAALYCPHVANSDWSNELPAAAAAAAAAEVVVERAGRSLFWPSEKESWEAIPPSQAGAAIGHEVHCYCSYCHHGCEFLHLRLPLHSSVPTEWRMCLGCGRAAGEILVASSAACSRGCRRDYCCD